MHGHRRGRRMLDGVVSLRELVDSKAQRSALFTGRLVGKYGVCGKSLILILKQRNN